MIKKVCSFLLAFVIALSCITPVTANASEGGESTGVCVNETGVFFYDGYVVENVQVVLNGEMIDVSRTIYSNNQMTIEITEDGVTRSIFGECDYQSVRTMLELDASRNSGIATIDRQEGYTYTYLRTTTQTYWYTPKAMTYYDVFNDISSILVDIGRYDMATLSTIAAIICANTYAEVETKIVVTEYWYEERSGGAFISYLCEYVATVYHEVSDNTFEYIGSTTGDYNTLYL